MYPGNAGMKNEPEAASVQQKEIPHWQRKKIGPDGKVIKYKPNPKKRNAVIRKAIHPKSAMMCLHELRTNVQYQVEQISPAGLGQFVASVEVDGNVYRGTANSKTDAKQMAAESALISFVKAPPPKPEKGQHPMEVEDETPWKSLASFAMYKLFSEWSEGKVGGEMPPPQMQMPQTNLHARLMDPLPATDARNIIKRKEFRPQAFNAPVAPAPVANAASINMHLGPTPAKTMGVNQPTPIIPKPAKNLTSDQKRTQHPVSLMHQLLPTIKCENMKELDGSFTLHTQIGETPYSGTGSSLKKAKFALAKLILKEEFDIDNEYEQS